MECARQRQENNEGGAADSLVAGQKFDSVQSAWFWFMAARAAQADGAAIRQAGGGVERPCEPIDILNVLYRLYRNRCLRWEHMLVLRHYGVRFMPPDPMRRREARAAVLWAEAMDRLQEPLIRRGIVAPVSLKMAAEWE